MNLDSLQSAIVTVGSTLLLIGALLTVSPGYLSLGLMLVGLFMIILPLLPTRKPSITLEDGELKMHAPLVDLSVHVSDLQDLRLTDGITVGPSSSGYRSFRLRTGPHVCDGIGDAVLIVHTDVSPVIIMSCSGTTYAFNLDSASGTEELYATLASTAGS